MSLFRTKFLYQEACRNSPDVHEMTDEELSQLKMHLLGMYKDIEAVCVKNNLQVMLAYGSVLGAVRHGGFIPWDDDMDLFMPRRDYELFIHQFANELPSHLKVFAPNSKNGTIERFAKVIDTRTRLVSAGADDLNSESQGIFVDIFPLDNITVSPFRNKVKRFVSKALMYIGSSVGQYQTDSVSYRRIMMTSTSTKINYWLRKSLGFSFSFFSYQKWMNILDSYCNQKSSAGYYADIMGFHNWQPVPQERYIPVIAGKFEGIDVFLPHDAIGHLQRTYGNWQKIPPENERYRHFIKDLRFK